MKIVMVLTSHDQLGSTGRKTGFWLEELAAPYYTFKDAGVEITLASPRGGRPPLDPKSNEPEFRTDLTVRFEKDAAAEAQLSKTIRLDGVRQGDFDTVFYPGGHGPMWDLAEDEHSIKLIESFIAAGKPIGIVCHSTGALRHVRTPDGKIVTCMDPRLSDLEGILGLKTADMDVIRTGRPAVIEDVLGELVVSTRVLGSKEIMLLNHTGCEFTTFTDKEEAGRQACGLSRNELLARGEAIVTHGDAAANIPACSSCHGPHLSGMEPAIPGLLGLRATYISAQLGAWRYGTRTATAPDCMQIVAGHLTEEDVKAIAAFLASRPATADPSPAPRGTFSLPFACGSEPQ